MEIPPIITYVYRQASAHLFWPASIYLTIRAFQRLQPETLEAVPPNWLILLICIFSAPCASQLSGIYRDRENKRSAKAHGAVLGPIVEHSAWNTSKAIVKEAEKPHSQCALLFHFVQGLSVLILILIADIFWEWAEKYGNTYRFKIPGENRVRLCS